MFPHTRIALVFDESLGYCRGVMRGAKRFAEERLDWVILPVPATPAAVQRLGRFEVRGGIAHVYNHDLLRALRPWRDRLVDVSPGVADLPVPSVGPDNEAVGRLAAEHLLERGFSHFGYVGNRSHAYSNRREAGFRQAVEAAGCEVSAYYDK